MDSKKIDKVGDSNDRLSELPDSLIIEILSFLPTTAVVATALLSKRWKHLWKTVPCLHFSPFHRQTFRNSLNKYQRFLSGALENWKGSKIHKLDITVYILDVAGDAIADSWLRFAIDKQVEELRVHNRGEEYCPPQRLYSCSSIAKLSLSYCKLRIDEAVQWNRLKSLEIRGWNFSLSEDVVSKIISGAPRLEELVLKFENFCENLSIRSTSLKKLRISGFLLCDFCFDAPSLTDSVLLFDGDIRNFGFLKLFNAGINNIETTFNQVFQSIRHVEKVTLSELSVQILLLMKKNNIIVDFPNATFLKLYPGGVSDDEILDILDMFPNLKKLYTFNLFRIALSA